MKKSKQVSVTSWKKAEIRPCPTGKCKHQHIKGTGPCIELGCGCHGAYGRKKKDGR
jgi:hypothetical protein